MTTRKQIKLGTPFTISVNNFREQELEVLNFHDAPFDQLVCKILNTTSCPPPSAYVTDEPNGIMKLQFSDKVPLSANFEIVIDGRVAQKTVIEEKTYLFDEKTKTAIKQVPKTSLLAGAKLLKYTFFSFLLGSLFLYVIRDSDVGQALNSFNAATGAKVLEDFDARIATNSHHVYQTAGFTMINAQYKREFGEDKDLRKIYRFVGDGFFVMKDVWLDKERMPLRVSKGGAENHCEKAGGVLLNRSELETYLAQQYGGINNFFWPVVRRSYEPEWADNTYSWMFRKSWLFLKEDGENPTNKKPINGFVVAPHGTEAAFRCGFSENFYVAAK